jgi:hypothetical protein
MRTAPLVLIGFLCLASSVRAQIKAQLPASPIMPVWDKGIQPISRDSYWNAIECGKQGGQRPLCVFYDADLCKNDDFTLAFFTPYKMVAYEVWRTVRHGQPALRRRTAKRNGRASRLASHGRAPRTRSRRVINAVARPSSRSQKALDATGASSPSTSRHSRRLPASRLRLPDPPHDTCLVEQTGAEDVPTRRAK